MNISLSDITYSYPLPGGGFRPALKGVSLEIRQGSCLGIIGPEGAGKTTLLLVLDMLLQPDRGILSIDGRVVGTKDSRAHEVRQKIGMEFQFPEEQFVAESVRLEILFGLDSGSRTLLRTPEEALSSVGINAAEVLDRSPFLLSMGEARRVALASLLRRDPAILLLDEPTAGLDGRGREDFIKALMSMPAAQKTMVIVSHDLDFLAEVATDVAVLCDGCLTGVGEVGSILTDIGLLQRAGYERPELIDVLEELARKGRIPPGRFYRAREVERLLNGESSEMLNHGK